MAQSEVERLRSLAFEVLAAASEMTDPICQRIMIEVAASYARLAEHIEERIAAEPSPGKDD
jgi:hypothetical protein